MLVARIVVPSVLLLTACSSTSQRLTEAFAEANPSVSAAAAECVVDSLVETYGAAGVQSELSAETASPGFLAEQARAMADCNVVTSTRSDLIVAFNAANPEATPEQAACVIDGLTKSMGTAELIATLWVDPPPEDFELAQFKTSFACGIDSRVRAEVSAQLAEQGTPTSKAPCVANAIVDEMSPEDLDVLITGQITDKFYAQYFRALQTCDALND